MFFHHKSIRKYTSALLSVFNDIEVPRYNEDGTVNKYLTVPIAFSTRERAIQMTDEDYKETNVNNKILPKMALSLNNMNKASNRDTSKYNRKIYYDDNNKPKKLEINSVSYDFSYTLHIIARTMTDLTVIIEQILPLFRPTYNIRIQELDYHEETTSLPLELGGVSFDFNMDTDIDEDIRLVMADIELTLRGNLYLPIRDVKFIDTVIANIISNGDIASTVETTVFGDETITTIKE